MERKIVEVRPGLYVTFISDSGIYLLERREAGLALIKTHIVTESNITEIVPRYYMLWSPDLYLIQTKETLVLNREAQLNKLL